MKRFLPWRAVGLGMVLAFVVAALRGQDTTFTPLAWDSPAENKDVELPSFRHAPRVDYPYELKKTDALGYIVIRQFIAADGKITSLLAGATHPAFERAFVEGHESKLNPARKGQTAVPAEVWYAIIFNPKSASEKLDTRAPRLLSVTPILVAREYLPKRTMSLTVETNVELDSTGGVTNITFEEPIKEHLQAQIKNAVQQWRFSPARENGQPTSSKLHLPVVLQEDRKTFVAQNVVPAQVIRQTRPVYPYGLLHSGMVGEVVVQFVVQTDGTVKNPFIIKSNHPGFEAAALEAVKSWKFRPCTHDGTPVEAQMIVPMIFDVPGGRSLAEVATPSRKNQEKIPEQLRFDVAPAVTNVALPVYPYSLYKDGIGGNATVVYAIDKQGKVQQVIVKEASRPEFGLALAAALDAYEFTPALREGKPTESVISMKQDFYVGDQSSGIIRKGDSDLLRMERNNSPDIVSPKALDQPLKPIGRRAPVFPHFGEANLTKGTATIETLIDEDGYCRLPRVVESSDPVFGYAAAQAVSFWRFEPPVAKGRKVVVRVRVPFTFQLKDAPVGPSAAAAGSR
jgi:TonB family protein